MVHARIDTADGSSSSGKLTITVFKRQVIKNGLNVNKNRLFTCRINHFFVVLSRLEVGQWSTTSRRERHHFESTVDQPFLEELLENTPDWFHEPRVKGCSHFSKSNAKPDENDDWKELDEKRNVYIPIQRPILLTIVSQVHLRNAWQSFCTRRYNWQFPFSWHLLGLWFQEFCQFHIQLEGHVCPIQSASQHENHFDEHIGWQYPW